MALLTLKSKAVELPECPEFKVVLRTYEVTKRIGDSDHKLVMIKPSCLRKTIRIGYALLVTLGVTLTVCAALYLPDYVADYSQRGILFQAFFYKLIGSAFLIVAIVTTGFVLFNPHIVYIDIESKRVIFSNTARINDEVYEKAGFDFDEIESVELVPTNGLFGTNKVVLLVRGEYHIVAEAHSNSVELSKLTSWLNVVINGDKRS